MDPASLPTSIANTVLCGADEAEVERRAAAIGRDVATARLAHFAGTPSEVIDRVGQYRDHGATTVHVETSSPPDRLRVAGPFKDGVFGANRSQFFAAFNTSKLSIALNLKHPAGQQIARRDA